jgi:hypothetical protein
MAKISINFFDYVNHIFQQKFFIFVSRKNLIYSLKNKEKESFFLEFINLSKSIQISFTHYLFNITSLEWYCI